MALNAANVAVARTGAVYSAPTGTALPTNSSIALNAAFVDLGYINEDGVTFTPSETATGIRAWQNNALVRTVFTETQYTFKFIMIEDKGAVAKVWNRASQIAIVAAGEWSLTPDTQTTGIFSWVIDVVDGTKLKRHVIEFGEITERGDQVFANGQAIGYEATVSCYASTTLGAPYKTYTNNTNWGYS